MGVGVEVLFSVPVCILFSVPVCIRGSTLLGSRVHSRLKLHHSEKKSIGVSTTTMQKKIGVSTTTMQKKSIGVVTTPMQKKALASSQ
jgi:hypothetical protein